MGVILLKLYNYSYGYANHDHKEYKQLIGYIVSNLRNGNECEDEISHPHYTHTNNKTYYVDFNLFDRIDIYYSKGKDQGFLAEYKHIKMMIIKLGLFDKKRFSLFSWIDDM
jgi:hypothetical protein